MRGLFGDEDLVPPQGGAVSHKPIQPAVADSQATSQAPASVTPMVDVNLVDWIDAQALEELASLAVAKPREKAAHAARIESIIRFLQKGLERFR